MQLYQATELCQRLNLDAVARVLNFAKFEFSAVNSAAP